MMINIFSIVDSQLITNLVTFAYYQLSLPFRLLTAHSSAKSLRFSEVRASNHVYDISLRDENTA